MSMAVKVQLLAKQNVLTYYPYIVQYHSNNIKALFYNIIVQYSSTIYEGVVAGRKLEARTNIQHYSTTLSHINNRSFYEQLSTNLLNNWIQKLGLVSF